MNIKLKRSILTLIITTGIFAALNSIAGDCKTTEQPSDSVSHVITPCRKEPLGDDSAACVGGTARTTITLPPNCVDADEGFSECNDSTYTLSLKFETKLCYKSGDDCELSSSWTLVGDSNRQVECYDCRADGEQCPCPTQ